MSFNRSIKNAVIESASISIRDHDLLTLWLDLDYGGAGQGFGGYVLLCSPGSAHRKESELGPNYAGVFIDRVLRIAGVSNWSDLPGKTIRADAEHGCVHGIGHIVKDDWFYPEKESERLRMGTSERDVEAKTA